MRWLPISGTSIRPPAPSSDSSTGWTSRPDERNEVVHSAVERKFEIIGESLSQLSKRDPVFANRIPRAREVISFRNLLIHGYALVEHARVWRIAHEALPALRAAVSDLIDELEAPNA